MFVLSMHSKKIKAAVVIAAAAVCVGTTLILVLSHGAESTGGKFPSIIKGDSAEERIAFLDSCGLAVDEEPVQVTEIIVPAEFDETYTAYNDIQLGQGFDLSDYCGKRVKRWTYMVTNYPGYGADADCIQTNLLVYDGLIIGGDVCSVELGGFMHGFTYGQSANETAVSTTRSVTTTMPTTTAPVKTTAPVTTVSPTTTAPVVTTTPTTTAPASTTSPVTTTRPCTTNVCTTVRVCTTARR